MGEGSWRAAGGRQGEGSRRASGWGRGLLEGVRVRAPGGRQMGVRASGVRPGRAPGGLNKGFWRAY